MSPVRQRALQGSRLCTPGPHAARFITVVMPAKTPRGSCWPLQGDRDVKVNGCVNLLKFRYPGHQPLCREVRSDLANASSRKPRRLVGAADGVQNPQWLRRLRSVHGCSNGTVGRGSDGTPMAFPVLGPDDSAQNLAHGAARQVAPYLDGLRGLDATQLVPAFRNDVFGR